MGLVDENADSDETMMLVTEKITDELKIKDRNSHLIVVGDRKTYEHLNNIKRHYGSELDRLLVFPGDWHILKNYLEVLMKGVLQLWIERVSKASQGFKLRHLPHLRSAQTSSEHIFS